jgi:DNA-binding transcriptional MerR regulator
MRITEVEQQSGLSRHTLRYYEAEGLIDAPPRLANNYRDYSPRVVEELAFIRSAQQMGFALAEIRSMLHLKRTSKLDCAQGAQLVTEKLREVEARMKSLRQLQRYLKAEQLRLANSALAHGLALSPALQQLVAVPVPKKQKG